MIYAGILAGGSGTRMKLGDMPKQFLTLGDKPIIIHTIEKFLLIPQIEKIIVGVNPKYIVHMEDLIEKYIKVNNKIQIVGGGIDRNSTIKNICANLNDEDIIITHDAVRPFVSSRMITENITLIKEYDAIDTVIEATDTIVESLDGRIISSVPNRSTLYQGQTPQTFIVKNFLALYEELSDAEKDIMTDACKIFVMKNKNVGLVKGSYSNIKITTVSDLKIARAMLEENYD